MNIQRIRDLREDSDYTQEYIAKLLNVNQRTYSRYEIENMQFHLQYFLFLQTSKNPYQRINADMGFFYTQPSPKNEYSYLLLIAAWAAANLAIGTRNGEQET